MPARGQLHELQQEKSALARRPDGLTVTNVVGLLLEPSGLGRGVGGRWHLDSVPGLVVSLFAMGAALAALSVALSNDNNTSSGSQMGASGRPSGSSTPAMGGGMMGAGTAGRPAPAGVHTVQVKLGEMWVRPQYTTISSGR
jgi:hypothetical protein